MMISLRAGKSQLLRTDLTKLRCEILTIYITLPILLESTAGWGMYDPLIP